MDDLTDLALAAQRGGRDDLAGLVRASYRDVWLLCSHLVDSGTADDLAQETFLRVFRALPSYRCDAPARAWLLAITRKVCMDELRSRVRRRGREDLGGEADAEHPAPEEPDRVDVRDLLGLLPPSRRAAFALTQLLGLSYEDTAVVCGCAPGTVRSRVARARQELLEVVRGRPEQDTRPDGARHEPEEPEGSRGR